jgi:hypothetical protein
MRDDNDLDRRSAGAMGPGTIAAVIAVLAIIGAIFMWGPWSSDTSNTAANPAPATTVGQSSNAPLSISPPHSAAPPSESNSPTTPTTR